MRLLKKRALESFREDGRTRYRPLVARDDYVAAETFTIADVMGITWIQAGLQMLQAKYVGLHKDWPHARRWLDTMLTRPAVQRTLEVERAIGYQLPQ